jgi:succinyl-CoA synthetase alpha subunit
MGPSVLDALLAHRITPRVLVQGITGRQGRLHSRLMGASGTRIVAGVSQSARSGDVPEKIDGIPVFRTCAEAVAATAADTSVAMVPPGAVLDAVKEAFGAGIRLIVTVAEGMPVYAALEAKRLADNHGARWIGPSTPGLAMPGSGIKLGLLPDVSLAPGPLAVMSKSGTLAYEACYRLVQRGIGQSLWVGVGGDPVKGTHFADLVPLLRDDAGTRGLLVIGEIGGSEEEEFAAALEAVGFDKPVFVLLAGSHASEGVTMGHAGALIHGRHGTMESKRAALTRAGALVFASMGQLVDAVAEALGGQRRLP